MFTLSPRSLALPLTMTVALLAAAGAPAQTGGSGHDSHHATAAVTPTEAVVRKVNAAARTITLKHGEIANLGMGPMTMVFQVRDPALLRGVRAGDRVRFTAERAGDDFVVRTLEREPR